MAIKTPIWGKEDLKRLAQREMGDYHLIVVSNRQPYIHELVEEGRVSVRNVRRDANHQLKSMQSEQNISEDEIKRAEKSIQEMTDKHIEKLKNIQDKKEKEILKV